MKIRWNCRIVIAVFAFLAASLPGIAQAGSAAIAARDAEVEGIKLHYLTAGHGPAVILLHGYAETSRMWKPIIPLLAAKFTVIAPDLPGIGDSGIPTNGLDMKNAAARIHSLVKSLGIGKARVVGHDIGLMVAYAYAAQFPAETEKLALLDAFLPPSGKNARGLGLLHCVSADGRRLRGAREEQADDARALAGRREGQWRGAGRAGEAGGHECNYHCSEELRSLGDGRAAAADDRRADEVPVRVAVLSIRLLD